MRSNGIGITGREKDFFFWVLQEEPDTPFKHVKGVLNIAVVVPGDLLRRRKLQLVDVEPGPFGMVQAPLDFKRITRMLHHLVLSFVFCTSLLF